MANKNRTEVSAAIQAQAAVVGETEYKLNLDDNFAQSVVFRKDVSASEGAFGATKTLDFNNIDYIEVTQTSSSCTYTLSNIQQGEIKYLKINKTGGYEVLFSATIDTAPDAETMKAQVSVLYQITSKDGATIYATPLSGDIVESTTTKKGIVEKATTAEALAGTTDKNITADVAAAIYGTPLLTKVVEIGDWNMDTLAVVGVTHGIADHTKIRSVDCIIREDAAAGNNMYPLDTYGTAQEGTIGVITSISIALLRTTGGFFDSTDYNQTSYNRGWVRIQYES